MSTVISRGLNVSAVLLALVGQLLIPGKTHAAATVKFVITAASAFMRGEPSLLASNTVAVFNAEQFNVVERTSDNVWVRLDVPRAGGAGTWLLRSFGEVIDNGDLNTVPARAPAASAFAFGYADLPGYVPALSARMRAVYQNGLAAGRDPNMFTVVGDCNSEPSAYIGRIASGIYQLPGDQSYLQGVIGRFGKSFSRISLAARGGYGTSAMMDSTWADPFFCHTSEGEGPFPCELRFSNASLVFIELGTGDQYKWREFESNYRPLIDHAISRGVVPVLVTKADDLESHNGAPSGFINSVIRRIAAEYSAPLLDFNAATRSLPNFGLIDEGNADFHLAPSGSNLHILATLQTLQAVVRGGGSLSTARYVTPAQVTTEEAPATSPPTREAPAAVAAMPASGTFSVVVAAANIRSAPGLGAPVVGRALAGQQLAVSGQNTDASWLKVGDGQWIFAALGSLGGAVTAPASAIATNSASAPESGKFTVLVPAANVRSSPTLSGALVGRALTGQQYDVLGRSDDGAWVRVGSDQWIFAALGQ